MPRGEIAVILVRPQEPGNVGAAARAMANFGLSRLILVAPRLADPRAALTWAHGAEDLCEGAEIASDLRAVLAPFHRAWGTTRRRGRRRPVPVTPRGAAREAAAAIRHGSRVAWVFGPETTGLAAEELALCSGLVTIPTAPRQPSLNLSHAVAVCLYETALALQEDSPDRPREPASLEQVHALYAQLEAALLAVDFLRAEDPARMGRLRRLLDRARLTPEEVRFLRGMARQIAWAGEKKKRGA